MPRRQTVYDLGQGGRALSVFAFDAREMVERGGGRYSLEKPGPQVVRAHGDAAQAEAAAIRAARDEAKGQNLTHDEIDARAAAAGREARAKALGEFAVSAKKPKPAALGTGGSTVNGDDFTKINGIGKALQSRLYGMGITTYAALADMSDEQVETLEKVTGFNGRVEREDWKGQARSLADEQQPQG